MRRFSAAVALTHFFHLAEGQVGWTELLPRGIPPAERDKHVAVWSDAANGFYIFGGMSGGGSIANRMNDLYFYSREADTWTELFPSGGPPAARFKFDAAWSDAADGFYVFGGSNGNRNGGAFNDLWFYSRQENTWTELSPSGETPARNDHQVMWSAAADGFYVFGGITTDKDNPENDVWFYSRQANSWSEVSPSGGPPPGRGEHKAIWSDSGDGFYVFGGNDGIYYLNDLWFYSRQANSWSQLSPSGGPPQARGDHAMVWASASNGFYVFGGENEEDGFNDIWFYGREANAWYELFPSGTEPEPRTGASAVWSDDFRGFFLFGGSKDKRNTNDLWAIRMSALTTATTTLTITSSSVTVTSTSITSTTTSSTTAASQELAGSFLLDVADVQGEQLQAAAKAALLRMEEGIRDAVVTLKLEGRGRRLQAIRRWRVSYILVVIVEKVEEALNVIETIGSATNNDFQEVLRNELVNYAADPISASAVTFVDSSPAQAPTIWTEEAIAAVSVATFVVVFISVLCLMRQVRRYYSVKRVHEEAEKVFHTENPKYRWAMMSARFDGGEVEKRTREVARMLKEMGCNILIVDAKAGTDYGLLTMQYLNKVREEKGVMLSVCTPHYGEKTASPYSSHQELIYALDNKLEVLPLKVNEIYPPMPPCGPNHRFDKARIAPGLISMIFKSSVVFVDCVGKTEAEIAIAVEERLRKQDYVEEAGEKAKQAALEEFKHENPEYRWAMISARFDGGEVEQTFREVVRIMKGHNCNILIVDAKAGTDYGLLTMQYLNKIRADNGVMVAVCTPHYGEKTASPYSSHQELIYALDNKLEVLPLKVHEIYPPQPPCGPDHRFDHASTAEGLISMMLPLTFEPMDCLDQSAEVIAEMLMNHLRKEVWEVRSVPELELEAADEEIFAI